MTGWKVTIVAIIIVQALTLFWLSKTYIHAEAAWRILTGRLLG